MTELITDVDGAVVGAVVERDGRPQRGSGARARRHPRHAAVSTTTWSGAGSTCRSLEKDWSFGNPAAMGDGIRAGEKVGGSTDLLDEAWWFPAMCWPDGRLQFMLNERMMPSQFVVNGDGQALHQRGGAVHGLRARDDRGAELRRHPHPVLADHRHPVVPPLRRRRTPADARRFRSRPVPTGRKVPEGVAGVRRRQAGEQLRGTRRQDRRAAGAAAPAPRTASTSWRATGHDDDFNRGDSAYDNYYGDPTLPNPNLHPLGKPPYYAFQIILGDLGTSGGLRTDEYARVLRERRHA